jgi:hypothetical protein
MLGGSARSTGPGESSDIRVASRIASRKGIEILRLLRGQDCWYLSFFRSKSFLVATLWISFFLLLPLAEGTPRPAAFGGGHQSRIQLGHYPTTEPGFLRFLCAKVAFTRSDTLLTANFPLLSVWLQKTGQASSDVAL